VKVSESSPFEIKADDCYVVGEVPGDFFKTTDGEEKVLERVARVFLQENAALDAVASTIGIGMSSALAVACARAMALIAVSC
jgi:hypothetical protein